VVRDMFRTLMTWRDNDSNSGLARNRIVKQNSISNAKYAAIQKHANHYVFVVISSNIDRFSKKMF